MHIDSRGGGLGPPWTGQRPVPTRAARPQKGPSSKDPARAVRVRLGGVHFSALLSGIFLVPESDRETAASLFVAD
jgi:hypothetical protein